MSTMLSKGARGGKGPAWLGGPRGLYKYIYVTTISTQTLSFILSCMYLYGRMAHTLQHLAPQHEV